MAPVTGPSPSKAEILAAAAELERGGLVAFPTETVYGLGADATQPLAIRRIFAAKGRPVDHPLIVHLADAGQVGEWAKIGAMGRALAAIFWPGPLTLVLRRKPGVADELTGGRETLAVRIPAHPVALALIEALGRGVAAPSANRFGRVSPTTAAHVREELGTGILVLDGGPCRVGVESTIVDLSGPAPTLLRPGGVPVSEIERITGPLPMGHTAAPGTLDAHYAPRTALLLSRTPGVEARRLRAQGLRVEILRARPAERYARELYAELRRLDTLAVDVLVAEPADAEGLGLAVNDRLRRAARGSGGERS